LIGINTTKAKAMVSNSSSLVVLTRVSSKDSGIQQNPSTIEFGQLDDAEKGSDRSAANTTNVPRVDGGKHAWLFLAGCFVFEALIWGE